ncbi:hypothetical protein [Gilliamella sp. Pas-s27]|uniref:hypothetical protein n=1 Tax=Gilliamella sp. Pas-s27 TaxID=2687311 RepID=UPI0013667AE8|nr:hypothetical protein [Gilliamella sp. Pas-s27]MWP48043.1 hypothetical protein [Gilliamella sp. Pas-s27]
MALPGFETIEEKATISELTKKLSKNRSARLDIEDCTEAMLTVLRILAKSGYNHYLWKSLPDKGKNKVKEFLQLLEINNKNPFTKEQFKAALRTSWTAELIGHLLVKYESEWYADEALSKWNEIDDLFEEEKQQQKTLIEAGLDEWRITELYQRDIAMKKVDEAHEHVKKNWQLEKAQRIKPSLWWQQVAQAQATQTASTDTPALSKLSADGKAWFIHPVAMMDYFSGADIVTYHIYHDGKIEKHIPQEILKGYEQKYKYVYHDKDNNEHEICIADWHTINKKGFNRYPRKTFKYPDHGRVSETKTNVSDGYIVAKAKYENGDIHEWIKKENGVSIYERLTMANGDIAEYGIHDQDGIVWRLYTKQQEEAQLVRMPDSINYESNDVVIKYELKETYRKYTNSDILAGFIGALAEIKENIIVTGSSYEQGSCFPSALHINGQSIDTKYIKKDRNLSDWEKDKEFVNALAKFHFGTFRIGATIYKLFEGISGIINGGTLHDSHLHTENFDFNAIKVIGQFENLN